MAVRRRLRKAQVSRGISAETQAFAGALTKSEDPRNVDIPSAVAWLRSFMYPEYTDGEAGKRTDKPRRPLPPRKMILGLPGVRVNWGEPSLPPSEVYCIMLACPVSYQAFFADGTPRIARVDLTFAEIIQIHGAVRVQDAFVRRDLGYQGYRLGSPNSR